MSTNPHRRVEAAEQRMTAAQAQFHKARANPFSAAYKAAQAEMVRAGRALSAARFAQHVGRS